MQRLEKQLRRSVIQWDARRKPGGSVAQELLKEMATTVGAQVDFGCVDKVLNMTGLADLLASQPPFAVLVTGIPTSAGDDNVVGNTFVVVVTGPFIMVDSHPHSGPHNGMIKATVEAQLGMSRFKRFLSVS